jgi:hypothetical protein
MHVQIDNGAPMVTVRSHRVVARALRLAAEHEVSVPAGALQQAVREWREKQAAHSPPETAGDGVVVTLPICLRSGDMLLTLGSTVRALVSPAEPLPAMSRSSKETPTSKPATPLVWHETQAWMPYRPERAPQTEPTAPEFQAYFEGVKAMQTHQDWLTGANTGPDREGEGAAVAQAIEKEATVLLGLIHAQSDPTRRA